MEDARNLAKQYEEKLEEAVDNNRMYQAALVSICQEQQEAMEALKDQHQDMHQAATLVHLRNYFDGSDCWKDKEPEEVRYILGLHTTTDLNFERATRKVNEMADSDSDSDKENET